MKKLMMTLAAVLAASTVFGAFKYETTLSVPGYTGEETLENFPLLVRISAAKISGFAYDKCQADGKDLVFTSADGKTVYPHEVDEWNVGGESLVWVKIPELKSGTTFKMKFGDATLASAPAYTANGAVWKAAGYFGVYHMNDTANAGTKDYMAKDSSPFGYNGQPISNNGGKYFSQMVSTIGAVGKARVHQTSSDWNSNGLKFVGSEAYKAGTDVAFSGWFNMSTLNGTAMWAFHRNNQADAAGFRLHGNAYVQAGGASGSVGKNIDNPQNAWVHVAVVFANGKAKIYSNGVSKGDGNCTITDPDVAYSLGNCIAANGYPMMGSYDEFRLIDATPSDAWIAAEYGCQSAQDYVTAGAVATVDVADTITVSSSSVYQKSGVSPDWGVSSLSAGTVTCTAPDDVVLTESSKFSFVGWKLRIVDAEGQATVTTGEGRTCSFTHVAGTSANLEWQHNLYYLATVTSSDTSMGSASGTGWFGENTTHTISATPNAGYELVKWTSADMLAKNLQDNPYSYKVTGPFTAVASFCVQRYTWLEAKAGNWSSASCWKDLDGDGKGDVPPADGSAVVVFPTGKSAYNITIGSKDNPNLYGIYLKAPSLDPSSDGNSVRLTGGSLTLGAGGVEMDNSAYTVGIKFQCNLTLSASQIWMNVCAYEAGKNVVNNNSTSIEKKLVADEGIVLTVSGHMPLSLVANDLTAFKGKIRTNCKIIGKRDTFLSKLMPPGLLEFYSGNEPYASSGDYRMQTDGVTDGRTFEITAPIKFDFGTCDSLVRLETQLGGGVTSNRWNFLWSGPLSGTFKDKKLSIGTVMASSSQHFSFTPHKQRNYFAGDNSGLSTEGLPAICFPHGVYTIAHANALGTGNVLGAYIGAGDTAGHFRGLTVSNTISVASAITIGDTVPAMLGMLDPGEGSFTGPVTENVAAQTFLHAVPGAKVHFSGNFTANNNNSCSFEVTGGGEVHLEGDNAQVTKKPLNVRSATAVLGHANAAGTRPINLGGVVPTKFVVRAVRDQNFGLGLPNKYTMTKTDNAQSNFTFTVSKLVFDGVTLNVGDTFLWINDVADGQVGRIFKVATANMITSEWLPYAEGAKVYVQEGIEYAGKTFSFEKGATAAGKSCGTASSYLDVTDPDVALLAKNGITVANDINVTENLSAGLSSIGVADASSVTFTGNVTLNRAVTFCAAAGGTATFTGTIADSGETKNAVGVNGAGTVVLPTLDWTDRVLDLRHVDDAALEASGVRSVTLLRAEGVGQATVLMPTKPMRWSLSVRGNSVRASRGGFTLVVR